MTATAPGGAAEWGYPGAMGALNTAAKQLVLVGMDDKPTTPYRVWKEVAGSVCDDVRPSDGVFHTAMQSLASYDLVQQDPEAEDSRIWTLTGDGETYGRTVAAYLIDVEVEQGRTLFDVLGKSPEYRATVLEALYEGDGPMRRADLEAETGIGGASIYNHLQALEERELVSYDSIAENEEGFAVYRGDEDVHPTDIDIVSDHSHLSQAVAWMLYSEKEANWQEVRDILDCGKNNAMKILQHFEEQGAVQATEFTGDSRSTAQLTEDGRDWVQVTRNPVVAALEHDDAYRQLAGNRDKYDFWTSEAEENVERLLELRDP